MRHGDEDLHSRSVRRFLPAIAGVVLAAALVGTVSAGALTTADRQQPTLSGEHGLGVWVDGDSLVVRWLTEVTDQGVFEATADGEVVHRDTTPKSGGHEVRFPRPDARRVTLRYGVRAGGSSEREDGPGALHETTIVFRDDDAEGRSVYRNVDSLFVVGDVHGQYDRLRRLLANAGLIDDQGTWSGGQSHLVLLGDLFDRGPDVTPTLWFLYRLEREARAAGGRVHVVLGNHEIMVLTGDLRYVAPKERLMAQRHGRNYTEMYDVDRSILGRWLATKPAALQIDDVLLAHGGIGPAYRDYGIPALNDSLRAWVAEDLFRYWADSTVEVAPMDSVAIARRYRFLFEDQGPFWYRGYANADSLGATLDRVLEAHDARLHVIAHTPGASIRQKYGGRLILTDLNEPASEGLLLIRSGDGYERQVVRLEDPPRPLEAHSHPN